MNSYQNKSNNQYGGQSRNDIPPNPIAEKIKKLSTLSAYQISDLVSDSEILAKGLKGDARTEGLKKNQLYKLYTEIVKIDSSFDKDKVIFLKPTLAYMAGRIKGWENLYEVLNACIDKVNNAQDFRILKKFFESIVAYNQLHNK